MTDFAVTDGAIRAKLGTYTDPYLGQTLTQAKAVGDVAVNSGVVRAELTFGFPVGGYAAELLPALESHLEAELAGRRLELNLKSLITAHAVQTTLQGRCRQVDHGRQPGAGLGGAGRPRGPARCRYLRTEPAAHDGIVGRQAGARGRR